MKQRLATLATLLDQQKQHRDAALGQLEKAREQAQAAQRQADDLAAYRASFHQRWGAQPGQRLDMGVLRAYQGFGERLEQAIGVQTGVCLGHNARLSQARQHLVQRELRVATTERLLTRTETALARHRDQLDQKRADDAAAQRLRARREEPTA